MPIVCGIHPVLEALAAGSRTIERVVVTKGVRNKRILEVIRRASERGVPLRFEPREALDRAADGERHQGVLAIVAEKGLLSLEDLQKSARTPALFMLLDGVEDPRNMGAIIRSVDASGADGVILPDRHTASLSDAASRTAAGALESVKIARIGNVVQALETLKAKGFWIVGFDGSGKERWDAVDYKRPVVLVLGGEGKGIRRLVKEHCDHVVSLPVFGQVSSLNVSVAAGIALYEAVRQRGTVPTMARPIPPRALAAKKPVVIGPSAEDREFDPGARRRAAAIASLAASPEPNRSAKPDEAPAPVSLTIPGVTPQLPKDGAPGPEVVVKEAALESIEAVPEILVASPGGLASDEVPAVAFAVADDEQDDDDDLDPAADGDLVDDDDEDGDDDQDDEDDEDDDAEDADDGDDEDDDEDDGDDDDEEEDGDRDDEDDEDEEGDDDGEAEDEDREEAGDRDEGEGVDRDDDDDEDDDDDDEDEDPGDEASDLATPFMPEDNSGGGEVTWGSEKELHAHRPRREGERRFGNNGNRRSGRPNDRKKKRKPQPAGTAAPQGAKVQGAKPQGGQAPAAGREGKRDQPRQQQRRGRDQNRGPRPPQDRPAGDPQAAENQRPGDGSRPEDSAPDLSQAQEGTRQPGPEQPRDPNRPAGNRRRNRRRRGGRGRNGGESRPGDQSVAPSQPREGQEPRGERGPRPESRGEGSSGNGEPRPAGEQGPRRERGPRPESQGGGRAGNGESRPAGEQAPREGGGGSEQGQRDRDRRRRRRRGRRGPGGSGGGQNGGAPGGGSEGGSGGSGGSDGGGNSGSSGGSDSGPS